MLPTRLRETTTYKKIRAFTERYERFFMPGMLLGGTAIDALQFKLLSTESTFIFAGSYAVICVASIAVMAAQPAQETRLLRYAKVIAPVIAAERVPRDDGDRSGGQTD